MAGIAFDMVNQSAPHLRVRTTPTLPHAGRRRQSLSASLINDHQDSRTSHDIEPTSRVDQRSTGLIMPDPPVSRNDQRREEAAPSTSGHQTGLDLMSEDDMSLDALRIDEGTISRESKFPKTDS